MSSISLWSFFRFFYSSLYFCSHTSKFFIASFSSFEIFEFSFFNSSVTPTYYFISSYFFSWTFLSFSNSLIHSSALFSYSFKTADYSVKTPIYSLNSFYVSFTYFWSSLVILSNWSLSAYIYFLSFWFSSNKWCFSFSRAISPFFWSV